MRTTIAGIFTGPQTLPLAVKISAKDRNSVDPHELQPVLPIPENLVIRGSHKSPVDVNRDGLPLAGAAIKNHGPQVVPPLGHINNGCGPQIGAGPVPRLQKGPLGVG
ncbi:disease resistance-responsive (dirigent-likeprotein) family protein [Striga asiatica]|uniref:Disease resistance-responsive (Dirigent-likeprotein) family protein n=1 Tax=Striga asiatica TaxID=4170 RepID=A0A5A7PNE2_STRAF|nr:disease resistance-responsive (dirigent-likeprotein) family protein [Striga asiatica]